MNTKDPNLPLLELVANSLGPLCEQLVFVGGCVTGLLITETAAPPVRATKDVDAIVEILSLTEYHALERQLENEGFRHDRRPDAPICRWTVGSALLDVMPTDESVLGFGNRWYREAVQTSMNVTLHAPGLHNRESESQHLSAGHPHGSRDGAGIAVCSDRCFLGWSPGRGCRGHCRYSPFHARRLCSSDRHGRCHFNDGHGGVRWRGPGGCGDCRRPGYRPGIADFSGDWDTGRDSTCSGPSSADGRIACHRGHGLGLRTHRAWRLRPPPLRPWVASYRLV